MRIALALIISLLASGCAYQKVVGELDMGEGRRIYFTDINAGGAFLPNVKSRIMTDCRPQEIWDPTGEQLCNIVDYGSFKAPSTVRQITGAAAVPVAATGYVLGQRYRRPNKTKVNQSGNSANAATSADMNNASTSQSASDANSSANPSANSSSSANPSSNSTSQSAAEIGGQQNIAPGSNDENILTVR